MPWLLMASPSAVMALTTYNRHILVFYRREFKLYQCRGMSENWNTCTCLHCSKNNSVHEMLKCWFVCTGVFTEVSHYVRARFLGVIWRFFTFPRTWWWGEELQNSQFFMVSFLKHTHQCRWNGHVECSKGKLRKSKNSILQVVRCGHLDRSDRHELPGTGSNSPLSQQFFP